MKKPEDTILSYQGLLDFDSIGDLIQTLKDEMRTRNVRFNTYKKVLTIMIESLENIIRYNDNLDRKSTLYRDYPPEFRIYARGNQFLIESANAILNRDIKSLNKKLSELNALDKSGIKKLYKKTITDGKFSEKGGAGLGIIEMAKIADDKLEFSFSDIDGKYSFFNLKLAVNQVENRIKQPN
ncbi:MAG: SiaB family protein kinase [Bacteroidales bacterium]|jgi:hypothetical protein